MSSEPCQPRYPTRLIDPDNWVRARLRSMKIDREGQQMLAELARAGLYFHITCGVWKVELLAHEVVEYAAAPTAWMARYFGRDELTFRRWQKWQQSSPGPEPPRCSGVSRTGRRCKNRAVSDTQAVTPQAFVFGWHDRCASHQIPRAEYEAVQAEVFGRDGRIDPDELL